MIFDRYYYQIEDDVDGRDIHILGNVYYNDTDAGFRHAMYSFLILNIDEFLKMVEDSSIYEYLYENVGYESENITEYEAEKLDKYYFYGFPGDNLNFLNVTRDSPCGEYFSDRE